MRFRISPHSKYSILVYNGPGNAPQNCPGSQFGPARIHIPNDISIGSAVSAQLTVLSRLAVDMKFCTHILIHRFYVDIHGWIYLYPQVPLSPVYMYYDSCMGTRTCLYFICGLSDVIIKTFSQSVHPQPFPLFLSPSTSRPHCSCPHSHPRGTTFL